MANLRAGRPLLCRGMRIVYVVGDPPQLRQDGASQHSRGSGLVVSPGGPGQGCESISEVRDTHSGVSEGIYRD
jgi:hypothetical protein